MNGLPNYKNRSSVRRLTLPNKKEMVCAQAAAQHAGFKRGVRGKTGGVVVTHFDDPRFVVTTRSEPVDGKNGAYYLYIRLEYK